MKKIAIVAVIAFAVTLAVVIGNRMSTEAMAVVVGVACGVIASIPASLLILAVSGRQNGRQEEWKQARREQVPPVIVIQGGQPQQLSAPRLEGSSPQWQNQPRSFEIVGQSGEEGW